MTEPSRERRLIDGVWQYVTAQEGGAGSLPSGGSTGEVLTKASNADGDADWEPGGGSMPEIVEVVVNASDCETGPVLVYTPPVGTVVLGALVSQVVTPNNARATGIGALGPRQLLAALEANGDPTVRDTPLLQTNFQDRPWPVTSDAIYIAPVWDVGAENIGLSENWQPSTEYDTEQDAQNIVEAGHIWANTGTLGTSGLVKPDFAGNLNGTVADGPNIVWSDMSVETDQVPSDTGSFTAYLLVGRTVAP